MLLDGILTNYLQPPGNFVPRPPLDQKLARRLLVTSAIVWICSTGIIGLLSYSQAYSETTYILDSCMLPNEIETCTETTSYPISTTLYIQPWSATEVVLHGPSYVSASRAEETIRGMVCQVHSEDGTLVYTSDALTTPLDFRRSCVNPQMPQIEMRSPDPRYDFNYDKIYEHFRVLGGLKVERANSNNSNYEITSFAVKRYESERGWMGTAGVGFSFDDGSRYYVDIEHKCGDPADYVRHVTRDCVNGWPYSLNESLCPIKDSGNFLAEEIFVELSDDPLWQSDAWKDALVTDVSAKNMSIWLRVTFEICEGGRVPVSKYLEALDIYNVAGSRPASELIKVVAEKLEQQCLYTFVCRRRNFEVLVWLAVSYPMLILMAKCLKASLPRAYVAIYDMWKRNTTQPTAQAHNSGVDTVDETEDVGDGRGDVRAVVAHLLEGLDFAVLCKIPDSVSKIEKRLHEVDRELQDLRDCYSARAQNDILSMPLPSRPQGISFHDSADSSPREEETADIMIPSMPLDCNFKESGSKIEAIWLKHINAHLIDMLAILKKELEQTWREKLHVAVRSYLEDVGKLRIPCGSAEARSSNHNTSLNIAVDRGANRVPMVKNDTTSSPASSNFDGKQHQLENIRIIVEREVQPLRQQVAELAFHVDHIHAYSI